MNHRVVALARLTCLNMLDRSMGVGLLLLFVWQIVAHRSTHLASGDALRQQLQSGFDTASQAGLGVIVVLAAAAVGQEVQARTLLAVMIRPITRHEYLLGRIFGHLVAYAAYLALILATALVAGWWGGAPLGASLLGKAFISLCSAATWIAIVLPLAAITSNAAVVAGWVGGKLLALVVANIPDAWGWAAAWAKGLFYYASTMDSPDGLTWQAAWFLVDNLACAAAIFTVCAACFARRDLPLRP